MEDAFLLLCQEFQILQTICRKQAELIQKLLSKKGIDTEMSFSKPIQCTDVGDPTCSEIPFLSFHEKKEPCTESSNTLTDQLLNPVHNISKDLDFDIKFPPGTEKFSFLANDVAKVDFDLSRLDLDPNKRGNNKELELFIKNYTPKFPNVNSGGLLDPISADQNLSFSNLYEEDLYYLQSKDISLGDCLPSDTKHPIVRGPAQSSWTPCCLSEECQLGHQMDMISDTGLSSQICDFCQAVFPAGSATKGEYLRHLTEHVE
ncbi:TRAF family member-associated NF-kappa-B activator-like isoform 1-T2 [Discoglossus pictus]